MKFRNFLIIIVLVIILVSLIVAYINQDSDNDNNYESRTFEVSNNKDKEEAKTTLKQTVEVKSALIEKVEPHATYYLEEVCVQKNQFAEKGANILKYTNGTYLTAPYDCLITDLNLPENEEKLLNEHYVELSSNNVLTVSINVDEKQINKVNIGTEVTINIPTLEKDYKGYVTNIASTGSNGKFKVTIEFENDGNIKLGMTSNIEMSI